jgi:hypothetical protein
MVQETRSHDEIELAVRKRKLLGVPPLDASGEAVMIECDTSHVHGTSSEIHRGDKCTRSCVLHREPTRPTSNVQYAPTPPRGEVPEVQGEAFDVGPFDLVQMTEVSDGIDSGVLVG